MNPEAARLYAIAEELTTTNCRIVQRDASGQIAGMVDVPTNVPRLMATGGEVVGALWSHQPASVDDVARLQQLDAMRTFCATAAEHGPPEAVAPMRERVRQITNAIRLHYDDPSA